MHESPHALPVVQTLQHAGGGLVGLGVGFAVGFAVGAGVGLGVGCAVGLGVARGVGLGVGGAEPVVPTIVKLCVASFQTTVVV
jgi:hypothetical protein